MGIKYIFKCKHGDQKDDKILNNGPFTHQLTNFVKRIVHFHEDKCLFVCSIYG